MVFERTLGVYKHIYHVSSEWPRKKEKYANLKWILRGQEARSENGYLFYRPGLKTGVENDIFKFGLK